VDLFVALKIIQVLIVHRTREEDIHGLDREAEIQEEVGSRQLNVTISIEANNLENGNETYEVLRVHLEETQGVRIQL
jgi:hypothetical protein